MSYTFNYNKRLGIKLPSLEEAWDQYSKNTQESVLARWEAIRGKIPDRIKELEAAINAKQTQLGEEDDFEMSCHLNSEISELASIINDLWIWYRMNGQLSLKPHS
jgi:hypothetical protein